MATLTPNYNLSKPEPTDQFGYNSFLPLFNENMDIIDENLGGGGSGSANQNIAESYDDTLTYSVGEYVIYNGLLYKCDTAVSTAEAFDPTKWTHVVVTDEMGGGGSGGHTIYDEDGNALAQENGLQFTGAVSVSDDSVNGRTVVDIEGGGNYFLNTLYSTEEKKIGYWTDGKPIYQRVWDFGSDLVIGNNAFYTTNIDSSNFETIVEGFGIYSTGVTRYNLMANTNGTNIRLQADRANGSANVRYLVLQYTKTTDTPEVNPQTGGVIYLPVIYSEEETQVGCWVDGKPLYQKSYVLPNTVNISSNTNLTTYMADITSTLERFIFAFGCGTDGKSTSPFYIQFYNSQITAWATPAFDTNIITVQYTKTTDVAGSGDWTPSEALAVHYSKDEQVIGTWMGETLYQKVFNPTVTTGNNVINHGIANFKECVRIFGKCKYNNADEVLPLPYVSLNNQFMAVLGNVTTTTYRVQFGSGFTSIQDCYVTIQYTKTS